MTLTWDVNDVNNSDKVCFVKRVEDGKEGECLNNITNAIITVTMTVGIPRITEATVEDFFIRINMLEKLCGPYIYRKKGEADGIRYEDLKQHIGLRTNASRLTWAKFVKQATDRFQNDQQRYLLNKEGSQG